jgi:hypothetical protein
MRYWNWRGVTPGNRCVAIARYNLHAGAMAVPEKRFVSAIADNERCIVAYLRYCEARSVGQKRCAQQGQGREISGAVTGDVGHVMNLLKRPDILSLITTDSKQLKG